MKAVVIGESSGASRDAIMAVYPLGRLNAAGMKLQSC
jgi:hypothetical protein